MLSVIMALLLIFSTSDMLRINAFYLAVILLPERAGDMACFVFFPEGIISRTTCQRKRVELGSPKVVEFC